MSVLQQLKDRIQGKAPKGSKRSSKWRDVRAAHLIVNPACELCGSKDKLEVHHIVPFHVDPTKELDPTNLITLCESKKGGVTCHLFFGHLGSYKNFNAQVKADVLEWRSKLKKVDINDPI